MGMGREIQVNGVQEGVRGMAVQLLYREVQPWLITAMTFQQTLSKNTLA